MTQSQTKRQRTMTRLLLPRRVVLRGLLGGSAVTVALPLLDAMLNDNGSALAQGDPLPKRLGIFFFGNGRGIDAARWTPALTGPTWELSPQLAPLAGVKDYINVVSNANVKLASSRGHHVGTVAMLSGAEYVAQDPNGANYRSTFSQQSIDQLVADANAMQTPFRSLEIRISDRIIHSEGTTLGEISHNGPDNVNPSESSPTAIYDRFFAAQSSELTPVTQIRNGLRKSVLDAVKGDINALQPRIGQRDRVRLEQHLENLRGIEQRIDGLTELSRACSTVARPMDYPADASREPLEERMVAMAELTTLALACDMTRAFSHLYTGSVGGTLFWQVGATDGHHSLSHLGAAAQSEIDAATILTMQHFAILLQRLKDQPEGAGNLLDNCAILCTSDTSDGEKHSVTDMPIVVAGRGGGYLKYPGVHYRADGNNTSEVLLTLLRATGVELASFGGGGGLVQQSATEIEA